MLCGLSVTVRMFERFASFVTRCSAGVEHFRILYFHSFIYRFGTVARGLDEFTLLDETYDRTYSLCVLCVQRGTDIRKYHIAHLAFSEQERDFTLKVLYWSWKQSAGAASTQTHIQCRQRMAEIGDIQYWQGKHRKEKHIFLQG